MGKGRDKKKKLKKGCEGGAKNKEKSRAKLKEDSAQDEEIEDIDAILRDFQAQQLEMFKVTEEQNCPPPSRRVNASFSVSSTKSEEIHLIGGEWYDGKKVFMYNEHFIYNTEKAEWRKVSSPNAPAPRASHQCVASNNGYLFLFGGEFVSPNESNFFHYKDFWMMDLKTTELVWEKLEVKGKPQPRSGHRMTKWKHFLVLFGGFFDQVHDTRYLDDLWLFDTQEFKWIEVKVPDPKPDARSGFQFLCHGDEIILYGGYSKTISKGKKIAGVMHVDTWSLKMNLDPSSIRWSRKKKAGGIGPGVRTGCTTIYHKGKGLMFGGVSDIVEEEEAIESVVHSDFFQFNLETNKFFPVQLKTPKKEESTSELLRPGPRFNSMMAISKNTLYMLGGILEENDKELTLNDFWSISADKLNEWTCLHKDETLENEWKGEESEEDDSSEQEEEGEEEEDEDDDEDDVVECENVDSVEPLSDPELEPKPGEKMGEYFERTNGFWLGRAVEVGNFGGKALRRNAFLQSERHFLQRLPANKILAEQLREHEVELEQAAAVKKEGEQRQRNR